MTTIRDSTSSPDITVRVGDNGLIETNTDPDSFNNVWVSRSSNVGADLYGVAYNNYIFVAVGSSGTILSSPDAITWTVETSPTTENLNGVDNASVVFLAVGADGTFIQSPNGETWSSNTTGTTETLWSVDATNGNYTIVGDSNTILTGEITSTFKEVYFEEVVGFQDTGIINGDYEDGDSETITFYDDNSNKWYFFLSEVFNLDHLGFKSNGIINLISTEDFTAADRIFDNPESVSDSLTVSSSIELTEYVLRTIAENFSIDEMFDLFRAVPVHEKISVSSVLQGIATMAVEAPEKLTMKDAIIFAFGVATSEGFSLNDTTGNEKLLSILLVEELQASGIVKSNQTAQLVASSVLAVNDLVYKYFSGTILESIEISDFIKTRASFYNQLLETTELSDILERYVLVRLNINDIISTSDTLSINQIIINNLKAGISFSVTFAKDSDVYTGWVMNLGNRAITNYTDYNFNSVARDSFLNKYYGAASDGIYELAGSTDNGTNIQATIRTAMLDFESSNLKTVAGAYLGYDADGEVIFKVITDDDYAVLYKLNTTGIDVHTDYVKFGKGLLGRYWQFELTTVDATKLDLDTLELYPIIAKRKR